MQGKDRLRTIEGLADHLGIDRQNVIPYGTEKAKVQLDALDSDRPQGKLVLVSAITPTKAGEGKTTTSIGLAQGLAHIGQQAALALREPSLGPTFGMKGGATGGGRSIVIPEADINLHFTGDFHAISAANNLLAALLDNHLHHGNELGIDVRQISWRRVVDLNDRALRNVIVGLGGPMQGVPRENGFDITPASEVMAVLCLSEGEEDLRARLSRLQVAVNRDGDPVTAADLKAVGSMMVVLKDALMPNLVQTIEGVPAFIHGGPFANIAHGCNSVLATKMALANSDWVVTEAGFGFDLGGEKFFDIKCRSAGLDPAVVVLVATVRALRHHGSGSGDNDPAAVAAGIPNLQKHIENARQFGYEPVVALNQFGDDTEDEIAVVERACAEMGTPFAVSDHFGQGGVGAADLAALVVAHAESHRQPHRPLYEVDQPIKEKMETVAQRIYGASAVNYTPKAEKDLRRIENVGLSNLPLCVAKTPASLSDNPALAGRPEGFEITVGSVVAAAGAGFVIPLLGNILRMPGLAKVPQAHHIDLVDGEIRNLR
ncbi:MAG: formate--tetrahydrofolate ligase [Acidobacteriota bacterium]